MKKLYILIFLLFLINSSFGQNNDLFLKISPKVDANPLVLEAGKYTAWNGVPYNICRLQYYISRITITHDGGLQTPLTGLILLTVPKTLVYTLGNYNIQNVESLEFYIGIDSKINHTDPTVYPAGSPLAPQNPSMNWGWAAGYRFLAIEGYADSGNGLFADKYEFHAIGDELFTKLNVTASSKKDVDGNLIIDLDADYNKLFSTVDLKGGMIVHGTDSPNTTIMSNFKDVFTSASATATHENKPENFIVNYANPTKQASIKYITQTDDIRFELINLFGQQVYGLEHLEKSGEVILPKSIQDGLYIMSFSHANKIKYTNKIILQK
ncbi:MAG TPA: MbnP family protein [Saprospiraceae bacterium]|nr:MbnP family protein [Saprospiraceae bacterium]